MLVDRVLVDMNRPVYADSFRYLHAAAGVPMARPFHLRWLLPHICKMVVWRWWTAYVAGLLLLAAGVAWMVGGWWSGVAAGILVVTLPGINSDVIRPVGVDAPAAGLVAVAAAAHMAGAGWWWTLPIVAVAATIRETSPLWAALWAWHPMFLIVAVVPVVAHLIIKTGPDPLGDRFQAIADHPVRWGIATHRGMWRNGKIMVAPWGVCLFGLVAPTVQVAVTMIVAYLLLLVATDTVRIVQYVAAPVLAVNAVTVIPADWLLLAVAAHFVFWFDMSRV